MGDNAPSDTGKRVSAQLCTRCARDVYALPRSNAQIGPASGVEKVMRDSAVFLLEGRSLDPERALLAIPALKISNWGMVESETFGIVG
jgi:hypothetical protein